jgi:hypothetical protein
MTDSILEELSEQSDDATIKSLAKRIQENEFSEPELTTVLQKLFSLPKIENHLEWLSLWVQDNDLSFLSRKSWNGHTDVFFRTLRFLETNLSHPNCGEILCSLLKSFNNIELEQLAENWLLNYGSTYLHQTNGGPELVGRLITHVLDARDVQNEAIVNLVWELCRTTDADFILVLSMLAHIPEVEVEALALKIVHSKSPGAHLLAGPLLARNSNFENEIRELMAKSGSSDLKFLLMDVGSKSLIGRKIVMEYLRGCSKSQLVGSTLQQILWNDPSEEVAAFAWQWFSENQKTSLSFELLEAALSCKDFSAPEEAISIAFERCKRAPKNEFWARLLYAALRRAPKAEMITYAVQNIHNCLITPDEARIMLAVNAKTDASEYHNLVMNWMKATLLKIPQDRFATPWLLHVVDEVRGKRPESANELNDLLEDLLVRTSIEIGSIYARLIKDGKLYLIPQAYSWLFTPRIEPRWGHLHFEKGELLKALLPHCPGDQDLLRLTQSWLQRGKNMYCKELREGVREAFELASFCN